MKKFLLWQEILAKIEKESTIPKLYRSVLPLKEYGYFSNQIKFLEKQKIMHMQKEGRTFKLTLTGKGKVMHNNMKQLMDGINGN